MGAVTTANIFFNQRLTSISRTSRDEWGDRTDAILYTNVPTRFTHDTKRVRNIGEDEQVDALAYIANSYSVLADDIVAYGGVNYSVVKVFNEYDLFGNIDHIKLTLKSR
jgi:hypothetical protein